MTDGFILWQDLITAIPDLDQRIERARFAIRRGGDRFAIVSVAHAELRCRSETPCLAAIAIGFFDAEIEEDRRRDAA